MKKLLLPLLALIALVFLFFAGNYLYERTWGIEGPFRSKHHHH